MTDQDRREFLKTAGTGIVASAVGTSLTLEKALATNTPTGTVRWGFVGTGSIANRMAGAIKDADNTELVAVSSRRMESAKAFLDPVS